MRFSETSNFFLFTAGLLAYSVALQWAGQISIDIDEQFLIATGAQLSWVVDRHPPLAGLFAYTYAWLTGFSTVAYFSISKINSLLALWVIYILNKEFLPPRLALLAVAAYAASFPFVFLSITIDHNSFLNILWPGTVLLVWRSLATGKWSYWMLSGLCAGLSIVAKYHSLILVVMLLVACFIFFVRSENWQFLKISVATTIAIGVIAPHIVGEAKYGFPAISYALASTGGVTNAVTDGRLSIVSYAGLNFLYNLFGIGLLLYSAWRRNALGRPILSISQDRKIWSFLMIFGVLFPLFPILLSLALGISLKPTWGMNAFFLTPTLILWIAYRKHPHCLDTVTWRRFAALLPVSLLLMTGVVVANAFTDVARPQAVRDFAREFDRYWISQTDRPLEMVVIVNPLAIAMTFYSEFHPDLKLSGPTAEMGIWQLDVGGCINRPTAIAWRSQTDWRDANGQAAAFSEAVVAPGRWTNLTRTKTARAFIQGFPDGVCF